MGGAGAQPDFSGGVQQGQQRALERQGQIPISGAIPEGKIAPWMLSVKERLDFIADLFHRSSGATVQSQGLEHVPALRLPDETVCLRG